MASPQPTSPRHQGVPSCAIGDPAIWHVRPMAPLPHPLCHPRHSAPSTLPSVVQHAIRDLPITLWHARPMAPFPHSAIPAILCHPPCHPWFSMPSVVSHAIRDLPITLLHHLCPHTCHCRHHLCPPVMSSVHPVICPPTLSLCSVPPHVPPLTVCPMEYRYVMFIFPLTDCSGSDRIDDGPPYAFQTTFGDNVVSAQSYLSTVHMFQPGRHHPVLELVQADIQLHRGWHPAAFRGVSTTPVYDFVAFKTLLFDFRHNFQRPSPFD